MTAACSLHQRNVCKGEFLIDPPFPRLSGLTESQQVQQYVDLPRCKRNFLQTGGSEGRPRGNRKACCGITKLEVPSSALKGGDMNGFVSLIGMGLAAACSGAVVAVAAEVQDFYAHWGDGRAEISSYEVVQPRYGQLRQGYGVLIFVTEDINRNTLIKVESPRTSPEDRIYVLKLNNLLKFTTGIYDYAVMTSVFSAVEGEGGEPFELRKLSLSAQEWCGHVYDEARVRTGRLEGQLNSYFEREGRHSYQMALPSDFASEDHLLIRIRELRGSHHGAWGRGRSGVASQLLVPAPAAPPPRNRPGEFDQGANGDPCDWGEVLRGHPLALGYWRGTKTVWVEKEYPRRILAWEDSRGGRGRLIETLREPLLEIEREWRRGPQGAAGDPLRSTSRPQVHFQEFEEGRGVTPQGSREQTARPGRPARLRHAAGHRAARRHLPPARC